MPDLAAAKAQCEAIKAFREDRVADLCVIYVPTGAKLHVGPHTSVSEVSAWIRSVSPETYSPPWRQMSWLDAATGSTH